MLRYLALLALLWASAATAAARSTSLPLQQFVDWPHDRGAGTVEAAGLTLTIEPRLCGDGRPVSEACSSGDYYAVVIVKAPGSPAVTLEGAAGVAHYVGVGKLGVAASRPSIFLITESGGSAGCVEIAMAVPDGAAYRVARLGRPGSDHDPLCEVEPARLAWPRDLTRHGRAELRLVDDRFSCAFTSCAGSWYPPRVVAIDGARSIDVSGDPALTPLFRADMAKARFACEHRVNEPQGACAGFAADAARLGLLPQAWPVIQAQARRGCRVESTGGCPVGEAVLPGFPAELRAALQRSGYISENNHCNRGLTSPGYNSAQPE